MKYYFIFIFLLLTGCNSGNEFPNSIENKKSSNPVEKVESFINKRFEKLDESQKDFKSYYSAVKNRRVVNKKWFESSKFLISEQKKSTRKIVREYKESSAGAYLSEQDNLYIERLLREKIQTQKSIKKELDAIKRSEKLTDKDINYSRKELGNIYLNIVSAKSDILNITQEQLNSISIALKKTVEAKNQQLWKAIVNNNYKQLEELTKDESYDSIIRPIILRVVFEEEKSWSLSDKDEIVFDVLNQSYTSYPFGYIKVVLEDKGVNSYITDEKLSKLNHKVRSSIKVAHNKPIKQD